MLLPLEQSARLAMGRVLTTLVSDSGLTDALHKVRIIAALHVLVGLLLSLYWRALIRLSSRSRVLKSFAAMSWLAISLVLMLL